ncbi:nibrin [Oxyura jamaicensis]|uniref:nibrin n=1 Tax=Oxyura jamaicensis TaxID=8884 RepID=UPI0015A50DBF|nr:nibrin [Oxyura jamaicensis]
MWKLVPAAGAGEPYRLLVGTDYVVGRRNCAILIQDDQSISRSHAVLTVSHPVTTQSQSVAVPILTIRDTSKYGTFVNGSKMNGSSRPLQSGDRVNFGVFNSKFRVEYESLVVCSSCLDAAQKAELNQAIQLLGGLVVNEWTKECTYLVMASVKVTVKTICALICGRPIIKPEFFEELIKAVRSRQQLPTPESFYPPVDEPSIGTENMDLSEHQERKRIFFGKTFVFLTAKQYKKLGPAVILGGGEAKLMTEGRKETSSLVSPDVCVVDVGLTNSQILGSESMRNWTDSILNVLQSNDLRAIPEAEIGLAVIFRSTETFCNSKKQPGNKAVTRSTSASGIGPAISQSLAVDETIMPTAADTSTLYVADTEIEEQPRMEIEKSSKTNRREKIAFQDVPPVKENPSTSGNVNAGTLISRMSRTSTFSQKSHPPSPSKISEVSKPRESTPRQQSNSITNYFQVARKRERDEEGGETSVPKLAKLEERSSPVSKCIESTASSVWNSEEEQLQKENNIQLTKESKELASDKTDAKITSSENPASKKRKELDDLSENTDTLEIVFESRDLDWKKQTANQDQESQGNIRKKRCLEAKGSRIEEVNAKQKAENETMKKDEDGSVLTLEMKSEIKQESPPVLKDHNKIEDDSSSLPRRLLLTEFRSLVVSHPRQNSQLIGNTSCGGQKNFKKFKKVTYPGAGQIPYIIGGSDLVAHHARKSSELEDWLREELEEQNRRAREESLADDLFRYDPNVKRRR